MSPGGFSSTFSNMLFKGDFEPPTPGSEVQCSIQLSYGPINLNHLEILI